MKLLNCGCIVYCFIIVLIYVRYGRFFVLILIGWILLRDSVKLILNGLFGVCIVIRLEFWFLWSSIGISMRRMSLVGGMDVRFVMYLLWLLCWYDVMMIMMIIVMMMRILWWWWCNVILSLLFIMLLILIIIWLGFVVDLIWSVFVGGWIGWIILISVMVMVIYFVNLKVC